MKTTTTEDAPRFAHVAWAATVHVVSHVDRFERPITLCGAGKARPDSVRPDRDATAATCRACLKATDADHLTN